MKTLKTIAIIALLSIMAGCGGRYVRVLEYQSMQGDGKGATFNGAVITLSDTQPNKGTTAVAYKDKDGQFIVDHSGENEVSIFRYEPYKEEVVKVQKKEFVKLKIGRKFRALNSAQFYAGLAMIIIIPIGLPVALTAFQWTDQIYIYNDNGVMKGIDKISSYFIKGKSIDLAYFIFNEGNVGYTDEFQIIDTVPDFFEIEKVTYLGAAQKVSYDVHKSNHKNILVMKITPLTSGSGGGGLLSVLSGARKNAGIPPFRRGGVNIYVKIKADVDKLKQNVYKVAEKK